MTLYAFIKKNCPVALEVYTRKDLDTVDRILKSYGLTLVRTSLVDSSTCAVEYFNAEGVCHTCHVWNADSQRAYISVVKQLAPGEPCPVKPAWWLVKPAGKAAVVDYLGGLVGDEMVIDHSTIRSCREVRRWRRL